MLASDIAEKKRSISVVRRLIMVAFPFLAFHQEAILSRVSVNWFPAEQSTAVGSSVIFSFSLAH